jgi:hypothetical protein
MGDVEAETRDSRATPFLSEQALRGYGFEPVAVAVLS